MNDYKPELGQAAFGAKYGKYNAPEFVDALLEYLLEEVGRVYFNKFQKEWNQFDDPEISGMEFRAYYWGDPDDDLSKLPNFKFKNVEIRWYKYPGRGMSVNIEMNSDDWIKWFNDCLEFIRKADYDIFEDITKYE